MCSGGSDEKGRGCPQPLRVLISRSRVAAGGGKEAPKAEGSDLPFVVEPDKCLIPPHEHRYVDVRFAPGAMKTFYGLFEASVELGTNPDTKLLSFDLIGEGTLPHVSVVQPTAKTGDGLPLLAYPRLLVGRSAKLPVLLKNEGILPCTVNVTAIVDAAAPRSKTFSCLACGQSITLQPGASQSLDVAFKPSDY